jgi:hypothetical protein
VSAQAGWYPDPGGGQGLFRYWDGKAWSAATSPYPTAAPPSQGITGGGGQPAPASTGASLGSQPYGQLSGTRPVGTGQSTFGTGSNGAYANYQQQQKQRSPIGWWIGGAALLVVIIIVAVIAIRAATGGGLIADPGNPGGQASQDICPVQKESSPKPQPGDGRVHGGPLSYPTLGSPWSAPTQENRLAFGTDVWKQDVVDQENYDGKGSSWVASVLVGELQAGDGFFTPEQGSQIVVKCIIGTFYGTNTVVTSDVKRNSAATVDGHDAWIVESHLSFEIPKLTTKGELLLVAIVSTNERAGLYYASIPDTQPELVEPARRALKALTVDN